MSEQATKFDIDTLRHSSAHLMAQAIERIWPDQNVQFGVGPVIEHGFYYDIKMDYQIKDEDLKKIQDTMKKIMKEKLPIERKVLSRDEAIKFFGEKGQTLKVELIEAIPEDEEIGCYQQGEFIDLCRGPHVDNTNQLPRSFKLLHTAGAYWKGDSDNEMLQRIYAVCFETKEELKEHLHFLEEAKKRDHRKLGKELELFHFDPVAPASPFFMPKGAFVYNELIEFMRRIYRKFGYDEVVTPQVLDSELWHTSGHYEHYKENMYFSRIDEREYAVKPMNCPCHMLMFKHYKYSYRDLPLRYADFGRLHRYEKAGAVTGLTRVRTFCQDDAHIFIPLEKIQGEIQDLMRMFFVCYEHFGFKDVKVHLSTRPEKKAGDDKTWDIAEGALKDALEASGHAYEIKEGDGAFYGPKIDVEIADALNRYYQLGTIQLDFQLPDRFNLKFTTQEGSEERPVVIHRALLGSLERFFGVYLEHVGGAFPFWLAPEQAVIVPVRNENHLEYSNQVAQELRAKGFRIRVDDRNESMGYKTRQIQKGKIPFMLVVGDQEMESKTLNFRRYGSRDSQSVAMEEIISMFEELDKEKMPESLR
ncbi:MAG: threonine--tRNA ligase [Halobacteriovorax sp.]|nr:threonine--tRNA ligase [Halobacteriovorax sp.]|tara:strand:+ start:63849 stop:65609 length:1761 start_codon:yes stop_codon:yes gene_type:complete